MQGAWHCGAQHLSSFPPSRSVDPKAERRSKSRRLMPLNPPAPPPKVCPQYSSGNPHVCQITAITCQGVADWGDAAQVSLSAVEWRDY
ncbi:hypothetical protein SKAU_G00086820 [Synaphobranchus kaupii]|uniref:Uncharacterized protein n=1 Tax=Synaphobranchus kaupii TaxID=118154 RepID=A0A9Q1FWF6_SYNKA|nr:hypothetical protein SKAU_G00086820 [Synaphobranchus kaupii]